MKYLKRYESFSLDVIENVKDILLEINDIGFQSRVDKVSKNKDTLVISIYKYDLLNSELGDSGYIRYKISDIKDIILRLNSYLSELGYTLYSLYVDCRDTKRMLDDLAKEKQNHQKIKLVLSSYGVNKIKIDDLDEMSDYIVVNTTLEFCKD